MILKIPTLSFCITCKNRFHQITQTLRQNLEDNRHHAPLIEFVLVDFGSTDGLRRWVVQHFADDLKSGYLSYYYTDILSSWHASIAKNTAHWYAKGDILVNLDCDNYTGWHGGKFVIRQYQKSSRPIIFQQFGGDLTDGTFGRIAVDRKFFHKVGGYDESFEPMGFQDGDLIVRLRRVGLQYVLNSDLQYCSAVKNTKTESVACTHSKLTWKEMDNKNRLKSQENISSGKIIANNGVFGIREGVERIYSEDQ